MAIETVKWQSMNKEKVLELGRKYDKAARIRRQKYRKNNREKINALNLFYKKQSPEKEEARKLLRKAIKDGSVIKRPCTICGNQKSQGHHTDYSKPLDILWLCTLHHGEHHRKIFDENGNEVRGRSYHKDPLIKE